MSLFAIGDFHLSGEPPAKPMEVFNPAWANHFEKIRLNWLNMITPEDTVIICGDTSWAMSLDAAMQDLNRIAALPGRKIILRGYVFAEQLFCLRRCGSLRFARMAAAVVR